MANPRDEHPATKAADSLKQLYLQENDVDDRCRGIAFNDVECVEYAPDNAWVRFTPLDTFGIALSGGGIRSATFNLGLLQGLDQFGLLKQCHYLSTVSGGGYIGAWWSAWISRAPQRRGAFPAANRTHEPPEIRHLRMFSNFLVPRKGFFEIDMWKAVAAYLRGLLVSLAVAASMLTMLLIVWLGLVKGMSLNDSRCAVGTLVGATILLQVFFECWWAYGEQINRSQLIASGGLLSVQTLVVAASGWLVHYWPSDRSWVTLPSFVGDNINCDNLVSDVKWMAPYLWPVLAWVGAIAGLSALRLAALLFASWLGFRSGQGSRNALSHHCNLACDRMLGRLAAMVVLWLIVAVNWLIGWWFQACQGKVWTVVGSAMSSGGIFVLLRNWLARSSKQSRRQGYWQSVIAPLLPQLLAHLTLFFALIVVGIGMRAWASELLRGETAKIVVIAGFTFGELAHCFALLAIAVITIVAILIDPHDLGLHHFYRERLCRAYLGASNERVAAGGQNLPIWRRRRRPATDELDKDDLSLSTLGSQPLHLICCAANDLSADTLTTLSRGARSCVLSRHGISIDGWRRPLNDGRSRLTLASAITASAAAFNSCMGSLSMRLGPAASFLMTALNLRLGLWVDNPRRERSLAMRLAPPLLQEMFAVAGMEGNRVHLSDGGHFENLALYELVRRHCRFVIVSDCGADPNYEFADFGNALRRIREDFGVDIEIDLRPLCPNADGKAQQHVVVGIIKYSADMQGDQGVLLYFKPTITGDEPGDVLEYRRASQAFPQQSTDDQFYDEAQWESYRRLGEHAARASLFFASDGQQCHEVFSKARFEWYPTPPELPENLLRQNAHFSKLERQISARAPAWFARQIFTESAQLMGEPTAAEGWFGATGQEQIEVVHLLVQILQQMEDVFLACHLDSQWNHPLNSGWMTLFFRWSGAEPFRIWWPLLKGIFSGGFRGFVEKRLLFAGKLAADRQNATAVVARTLNPPAFGLAADWWTLAKGNSPQAQHGELYECVLQVANAREIQIGLAVVKIDDGEVSWNASDFFVAPVLWSCGFGGQFLDLLLIQVKANHQDVNRARVVLDTVKSPSPHPVEDATALARTPELTRPTAKPVLGPGRRAEIADDINFYRGHGFHLWRPAIVEHGRSEAPMMVRACG